MAFKTGERWQADGMALEAGGPLVVDTILVTTVSGRMRQVESGRAPGSGGVALIACHVREQPGMIGWVGVTGNAGGRENGKDCIGMAFGACQPGMSTCKREFCL